MAFDREKIDRIAKEPGVYLMKSAKGAVLYVGKAKNLRSRVRSYFSKSSDSRCMVPLLVAQVADIETIVVTSEKEALLLENNLIKKHQPKYNVLLKDDKSYIALQINHKHEWPTIKVVRYRGDPKKGALYFGPYTSALAARRTLDLLNKIFPLRQCSDKELKRRTRPCILHGMKRCVAPCVNLCTREEYDRHVDQAIKFLQGKDREVLAELKAKMKAHAEKLEFEKAGEILQTLRLIEKTVEGQNVDRPLGIDCDALALYRESDEVTLCQLLFRNGKLIGSSSFHFQEIAQEEEEIYLSFILQHYEKREELPREILLPTAIEEAEELSEILSEGKARRVKISAPKRGERIALINLTLSNAEASFKKEKDEATIQERTLAELQERLKLTRYPRRIECFDNSNLSYDEPVSSMVAFTDGLKDSSRTRKYTIKRGSGHPDDYAAMREVLERRYRRAKAEDDLPDLIIVDGGKGQLNIALSILSDLDISTVDVIGVAKDEGRHDRGMNLEQIFLPNAKEPLFLKRHSPALFLLQKIRDETHRAAITFHRKRREKKIISSELDKIEGIGVKKRTLLLKKFGSVAGVKRASFEELCNTPGISQRDASKIVAHFSP